LQGIYYGGTSSALNSAYEGKDWEQTKAALPGDIAMNVGMQMVPAGLIRALGKVGSRKVADAANTAAGVGTNKRRELMATLQEMGVPGKEISTMTTEQLEKRMATIGMPEAPSGEPTKAPLGIDAPQSEI
jgi:hypothetical protein